VLFPGESLALTRQAPHVTRLLQAYVSGASAHRHLGVVCCGADWMRFLGGGGVGRLDGISVIGTTAEVCTEASDDAGELAVTLRGRQRFRIDEVLQIHGSYLFCKVVVLPVGYPCALTHDPSTS